MAHRSGAGIRDVSAPKKGRVGRAVRDPAPRSPEPRVSRASNDATPQAPVAPVRLLRSTAGVMRGRGCRPAPIPTRPGPLSQETIVSGDRRGVPGVGRIRDSSGTIRLPDSISLTRDQRVLGTIPEAPSEEESTRLMHPSARRPCRAGRLLLKIRRAKKRRHGHTCSRISRPVFSCSKGRRVCSKRPRGRTSSHGSFSCSGPDGGETATCSGGG